MPAHAGALTGLISWNPAAERPGDICHASGTTGARPDPTGVPVGPVRQLRHQSGLPDRSGNSRSQAAAISPAPCPKPKPAPTASSLRGASQ